MSNLTGEKKEINLRLMLIPVQFIGFYLLAYLLRPGKAWYKSYTTEEISLEVINGLIFCFLLSEISILIIKFLDRHMPWQDDPLKRSVVQFGAMVTGTVIFSYCYIRLMVFVFEKSIASEVYANSLTSSFTVTVLVSLLTSAGQTVYYLLKQWRDAREETLDHIIKAEELERIAMEFELQSLRMQLDPISFLIVLVRCLH